MDISDIAALYDTESESHFITTEDGYINQVFRLRNLLAQKNKEPAAVMLIHGLLDSGDSFCINGKEKSPAFILADEGYDVWIVNTRGNKHSIGHENLNSETDVDYWKNSMGHHIRQYDLPSFVEAVKNISQVESMSVVAHSYGTNMFFKNFAQNQSYYKENINLLITLAPFGRFTSTSTLNTLFVYFYTDYLELFLKLGYFKAFDVTDPHIVIAKAVCLYLEKPC